MGLIWTKLTKIGTKLNISDEILPRVTMLTWHVDNIFKIKKIKKKVKKNHRVTRDNHCSPFVNDLNGVCKKDEIDHQLQKWGPFRTFRKNEDQTKQSSRKLGPKRYLSLKNKIN